MSLRKLSDSDVQMLIELWRNERSLLGVTFPKCSKAVERKEALSMIHGNVPCPVVFAAWYLHTPAHTSASAPLDFLH